MHHQTRNYVYFSLQRTIDICLFFLLAIIPIIINPFALDYWYKPKIDSIYGLIIIIGGAVILRYLFFKEPVTWKKNPLTIPLLAYGAVSILSTIFSTAPKLSIHGDQFREEGIFTILSYITLTFIFTSLVKSVRQIHFLLKALLSTTALISLYGIVQYFGYNPTEHFIPLMRLAEHRAGSTIGNPNFLGKFLVLLLPLLLVYYLSATNMVAKCLFLTGILFAFTALIMTFTRASWLGFCCSLVVIALLVGKEVLRRKKGEILTAIAIMVALLLLFESYHPTRNPLTSGKIDPTISQKLSAASDLKKGMGAATRLFVWQKALILIRERPLFGFGPDTHIKALRRFNLEYARQFNDYVIIDRAHNNYLDLAIAQGLVGLGTYLAIITTFLVWLGRTMSKEKEPAYKLLYAGILAAYCGYLVNDLFIFSVVSVSPTFWSLMGITIALKKLSTDEQASQSK